MNDIVMASSKVKFIEKSTIHWL